MKISALIAEFNPFHTGHKLLVDSMHSKSDAVIAIMSGNFVQRGDCALFDKQQRAIAAIKNGVDLILELPAVYALASAEGFARGAVETLNSTGVVDELHFGSECANIDDLCAVSDMLNDESTQFSSLLGENLARGMSFPAARRAALGVISPLASVLDMPNNILAVEYIRQLKKSFSSIKPVTIPRTGSDYNDTQVDGTIASASAIRVLLEEGRDASEYMLYSFRGTPMFMKNFDALVCAKLKTASQSELLLYPDCNAELAVRLHDASKHNTFKEVLCAASCKGYTQSRIRRILCNILIGNRFSTLPDPGYIRPLAFNKKGSEILRKMKSTASLPIIARGALLKDDPIFALECRATDIYNLARGIEGGAEFETVPYMD